MKVTVLTFFFNYFVWKNSWGVKRIGIIFKLSWKMGTSRY